MQKNFDRRSFLKGSLIAGAAAATAGLAAGCAPQSPSTAPSGNAAATDLASTGRKGLAEAPNEISETIDTEILVVGAGVGGLACAVQAALNGNEVLLIEKASITGGNGNVIEGTYACGSDIQKAQGYEITVSEAVSHEMEFAQYRVDGTLWYDYISNSVDNMKWFVEQGVELRGDADYYGGLFCTHHWFKDGLGSAGYVPQMTSRAEELGVEIRTKTPAYKLIQDEGGTVVGAYAKSSDGKDIRINAKATVIATGGWGCNEDIIAAMGYDTTDWMQCGTDNHDGDGYLMAMEVGAQDMLPYASQLALNYCPALPRESFTHPYNGIGGITSGLMPVVWVNEEGNRFSNECVWKRCIMYQTMPVREQKEVYTIFDSKIWADQTSALEGIDAAAELEEAVAKNSPESLWKADTIEGLAEAVGIDAKTLSATIQAYNSDCAAGKGDTRFGKAPEDMAPISTPPYYIARNRLNFVTNFGGIGTNRKFEVVNDGGEAIPGLFAAGLDGDMRYRNVYPINMGGTASGGAIYSGRIAANSAKAFIEG